jgi:NTP pyrophosphatase (non-canonical NTP hydrolase)
MSMSNNGLVKLVEECGELIQVAAKLIAYPDKQHPDNQGCLGLRIEDEIADVLAAIEFVRSKLSLSDHDIEMRVRTKLNTFSNWDKQ